MSSFVRRCAKCAVLHDTDDGSGESLCIACDAAAHVPRPVMAVNVTPSVTAGEAPPRRSYRPDGDK